MESNQQLIAACIFEYLKNSYNNSAKGIPISDSNKNREPNLYDWAEDGLPDELKPVKTDNRTKYRNALRTSIKRALELLMEQYPGSVGFYIHHGKDNSKFHSLNPGEKIEKGKFSHLPKKTRYYLVKGDTAIPSLNSAYVNLIENAMGQDSFGFLNTTLEDVLSYSKYELNQAEGVFHNNWLSKIEFTPRYQQLYPPTLEVDAEEICKAIFLECSFSAQYLGGDEIRYWPVRLIKQERVLYVLCKTEEKGNYEEYAIHRFSNVQIDYDDIQKKILVDRPDWISYDVDEINKNRKMPIVLDGHSYIKELTLEFYGKPAQHMFEVSFHPENLKKKSPKKNILLEPLPNPGKGAEHIQITAYNIPYNYNFLTWLLGFGSQVKVVEPKWLKDLIIKELKLSLERY